VNRLSRTEALMGTAYVWAERSTCDRLHVGAVIHRDGHILVQGYNGAPAGLPHCIHDCTCTGVYPRFEGKEEIHSWGCPKPEPCTRAVHAEQNAISFAARWGVGLEGAEIVVTHQPCLSCAMSIINAGLSSVTYNEPYRLREGLALLLEAGITVEQTLDFCPPGR
jgi:dCMP deaminase